jgi:hypothetical protein
MKELENALVVEFLLLELMAAIGLNVEGVVCIYVGRIIV